MDQLGGVPKRVRANPNVLQRDANEAGWADRKLISTQSHRIECLSSKVHVVHHFSKSDQRRTNCGNLFLDIVGIWEIPTFYLG